jgi:Raf kinase inhibitor-like YbhB/YbcL family protein
VRLSVQGRSFTGDELWPPWTGDGGFLDTPSIVWFGVTPDVVALATGEVIPGAQLLALLRSSPRRVWDDFTLSRYELGSNILTPLAVLGAFFVLVYAALAAAAAFIILSITRSVRRLSAGAREGRNDWKRTGWGGPCPPIGRHRYFFKLYALDAALGELGQPTKAELEKAMRGHVLAEAVLMGTYQKGD